MYGIADIDILLATASPAMADEDYVFTTVRDLSRFDELQAVGAFREREAVTLICPRIRAESASLPYDGIYRQITLTVHSSLEAVGFLAAVSTALADAGIPCNAVSAFYHDHIFVPAGQASRAMEVLSTLAASRQSRRDSQGNSVAL
jgi:hypothetical protein